jgi:hypothetical protein
MGGPRASGETVNRRYAEYRPATRFRPVGRFRLFRTARLNVVGWAAFAGLCLAGAAVAAGIGAAAGLSVGWAAAAGAAVGPVAVLVADRRKWNRMSTGYGWGATVGTVRLVADELRRAGVPVEVQERPGGVGIRVRNRDRRRAARVLAGLGVPPPPSWV